MRIKLILVAILIFISNMLIIAQQNRFDCLNQNFVENEIKAMRFGHFFNLELKKGSDRDKQLSTNYRQQALFYQNKKDEEFNKCQKLPACTKNFITPSFNSQEECINYLNSLESKKEAINQKINELSRSIGQLQSAHRYSEMIPLKKKKFSLAGEKACIEEQIKGCNCGFIPTGRNNDYEQPNTDYNIYTEFDLSGNGWGIKVFQSLNENTGNSISQTIKSQYTPVGIAAGDYSNQFVFIEGDLLGITNWSLETYTDVYSLQNGITNYLNGGYSPMGISFTDRGELHVLYILSNLQVTAWQLVESELDLGSVSEDVHPYIHENYIPVGITVFGGMYYTLLVQVPDTDQVNWTIEGYEDNTQTVSQGINYMASQGLVPFGFLNEQGVVNVLYIGF